MKDYIVAILTNGAVWAALIALVNGIIIYAFPDVPRELLALAQALVAAILGAIGIFSPQGVRAKVKAMRYQRARGEYRA